MDSLQFFLDGKFTSISAVQESKILYINKEEENQLNVIESPLL